VVGTGAIVTGSHLPALRAHGDRVELIAAVDVDTDRLKAFCETAGPDVTAFTGQPVFAGEIGPGDPYCSHLHGGHPRWAPKGTGEKTG
jgi:hypothetical protein